MYMHYIANNTVTLCKTIFDLTYFTEYILILKIYRHNVMFHEMVLVYLNTCTCINKFRKAAKKMKCQKKFQMDRYV